MSESTPCGFALFSKEKIQPAINAVLASKRLSLYLALGIGLILFFGFAAVVSHLLAPYRSMTKQYNISYWPVMLLAPSVIGIGVFFLVYILGLQHSVNEFHASVLAKLADFIAFGTIHETGKTLPSGELEGILLASLGGKPFSGTDQFHCRLPGAAAHFSTLRIKRDATGAGKTETLTGLYFYAVMEQNFAAPIMVFPSSPEIDASGFETRFRAVGDTAGTCLLRLDDPSRGRQFLVPLGWGDCVSNLLSSPAFVQLEDACRRGGAGLYLSCQDNCLRVALLSPSTRVDSSRVLNGFDFGHCRDVRLCLDMAFDMSKRNDRRLERTAAIGRKAVSLG